MIPGTTNFPVRSITVAPVGAAAPGPMSRMRPLSITIVTLLCGGAPLPSMSVALRRTVTCAAAASQNSTAAARASKRCARMRFPRLNRHAPHKRGMAHRSSCRLLGPAHHGRREVLDRGRAHLLDHGVRLLTQDFEDTLDTGLAEGAEAPDVGPPHAHRRRAHTERLDDVRAATEARIDQNRDPALHCLDDLRQRVDGRATGILAARAV